MSIVVAVAGIIGALVGGTAMALASKPKTPSFPGELPGTGALTEDETKKAASKRLFRAGLISTSPTGLGSKETLATTRLQ